MTTDPNHLLGDLRLREHPLPTEEDVARSIAAMTDEEFQAWIKKMVDAYLK